MTAPFIFLSWLCPFFPSTAMVLGIYPRGMVLSSGYALFLRVWMLSVSECSLWFHSSSFSSLVSPGSVPSCGCIVLFRPSLMLLISGAMMMVVFLQCEFLFCSKLFPIRWIYGPNQNPEHHLFLEDLNPRIDPSIPTILAGDFNTEFDRSLNHLGSDPSDSSCKSSSSLLNLFYSCCVVDILRYLHPSASGFTWTRWNGSLALHIDLIAVPYVWVSSVLSCDIVPCPFSDHSGVSLCTDVPDVMPPSPFLQKLNTSICEDESYVKLISDAWSSWRSSIPFFPSLAKWWKEGKSLVKGLTIRFHCDRSASRSTSRDLLVRLADQLKAKIDARSVSCLAPYQGVLSQSVSLDLAAAKGAEVRSCIHWVEEGETSSAYFFHLEKKNATDRWISALREDDGSIISSVHDCHWSFCAVLSSF